MVAGVRGGGSFLDGLRRLMFIVAVLCMVPAFALSADGTVFRVVVLGSSTAAGEAARPLDSSWVNKYKMYLGSVFTTYEVINLAVGGYTTFNIMPNGYVRPAPWDTVAALAVVSNNNITKALSLNPSLILINMPTNDSYRYIPVSQQIANFDVLVNAALNANVPVYLSTSQPRTVNTTVQNLLIDLKNQMLSRYAGRVMDFWTGLANPNGSIKLEYDGDGGTHLNNAGHAVLFQRAVDAIQLPLPVSASPKLLGFGNHTRNTGTVLEITISNPTASTLTFDNITTGTSVFASNRSNATALPGSSFIVQVTFTPPALGSYQDTLYLHNNSSLVMVKIPLSGSALPPVLQAVPSALAFGAVNRTTGSTMRLALRNGDLNGGTITSVTSASGQFSATPSTGNVVQGDSLILQVKFSPAVYGQVADTLRLFGVVAGGVVKVPVAGNSPVPVMNASTSSLDFGDISMASPKTLDLTLSNPSVNDVVIDAIANSNAAYFSDPASAMIPPNGSVIIHVTFAPSTFGTSTDTLQVISNAVGSPLRVPLAGRVPLPGLSLSRTSITFPMTGQSDAVVRPVYMRNDGASPVTITSISGHTPHFSSATALPLNVASHDSTLVGIRFAPQAAGDMRDTLIIATNAGPTQLIVSGSSPSSYLKGAPAPVGFGSVKTGTTIWKPCVLRVQSADAGFTIAVDSVKVIGSTFGAPHLAGRVLLTPADSLKLMVAFSPSALATYADTLLIYNDSYVSVLRVPLSGKGDTFTDVGPVAVAQPGAFALLQNYPNPFNPSTQITFVLERAGEVSLRVFDVLGREVAVLQNGWRDAGVHQVQFHAAGLPSGMYVYLLRAGDQQAVRRMLLMK